MGYKKRREVESYILVGGEQSNPVFECISNWHVPPDAIPLVKELMLRISEDVDVRNAKDGKSNGTPLMFAVKFDVEKAVLKLIERGAKIEAIDFGGCNALHWAAFYDRPICLKVLLGHTPHFIGCKSIDVQDVFGRTPLILAAQLGSRETVRFLLQTGASTKIKDKNQKTAHQVATLGCSEIIKAHEGNLKK